MTTEQEELNPEKEVPTNTIGEDKSLWDYFVLCLTEKYFCFTGRARRKEYWSFVLFQFLINVLLSFITDFLNTAGGNVTGIEILSFLLTFALFVPSFAVLFRRLHDVNFSGWWATAPWLMIMLIPFGFILKQKGGSDNIAEFMVLAGSFLSAIPFLVVFSVIFFKSDMKENKYGPVPEGVK